MICLFCCRASDAPSFLLQRFFSVAQHASVCYKRVSEQAHCSICIFSVAEHPFCCIASVHLSVSYPSCCFLSNALFSPLLIAFLHFLARSLALSLPPLPHPLSLRLTLPSLSLSLSHTHTHTHTHTHVDIYLGSSLGCQVEVAEVADA